MNFVKYDVSLAVDRNFSIGVDGDLLVYIKDDLKKFKERTVGQIIVMGRKTLDSLPGGKPLPNRDNIVVSRSMEERPGLHVASSLEEIPKIVEKIRGESGEDKKVFLTGGGNLIRQLMDEVDRWYITYVDKAYENFDTQIPNLFEEEDIYLLEDDEWREEEGIRFKYLVFKNKNFD